MGLKIILLHYKQHIEGDRKLGAVFLILILVPVPCIFYYFVQ